MHDRFALHIANRADEREHSRCGYPLGIGERVRRKQPDLRAVEPLLEQFGEPGEGQRWLHSLVQNGVRFIDRLHHEGRRDVWNVQLLGRHWAGCHAQEYFPVAFWRRTEMREGLAALLLVEQNLTDEGLFEGVFCFVQRSALRREVPLKRLGDPESFSMDKQDAQVQEPLGYHVFTISPPTISVECGLALSERS